MYLGIEECAYATAIGEGSGEVLGLNSEIKLSYKIAEKPQSRKPNFEQILKQILI